MIPVLGIPVLNRGDLLRRCVSSIDYPIDTLVIINNGREASVLEAIEEIRTGQNAGLMSGDVAPARWRHLEIIGPSLDPLCWKGNRGVPGSWNEIARQPGAYHLIVGNDILFQPGDLATLAGFIEPRVATHTSIYGNHGHSLFAITPLHREIVGTFDENFYPAYLEDCDDSWRIRQAGGVSENCPGLRAIHGEAPSWGSSTIFSDPHLRNANGVTHGNNFQYYFRKWGGMNGGERFRTPFNRGGDIRSWELEPEHRKANSIW